jgi:hypothetical protein
MLKNKFVFLSVLILIPLVIATYPGIPHQFYGGVIVNENVMQSGIVTAKINNQTVGTTTITSGKYGYNPIFFIEDKNYNFNGKKIFFYVNGFNAGNYTFENGASTRFDLIVGNYAGFCGDSILSSGEQCDDGSQNGMKCDNSDSSCNYCSSSCKIIKLNKESNNDDNNDNNGGSSRRMLSLDFCEPDWKCSQWGECFDGIRLRSCEDKNGCGTSMNKPDETRMCEESLPKILLGQKEGSSGSMIWIIIAGIIIMALLVVLINRWK